MVVQENQHSDMLATSLKNDKKHRLKQRFDVKKKLGQGTYGKVQLAVIRETGQEVAIKTIKKVKIENEQDLIRIRREIQIMSSIQHPHLIHIYEVFENKDKIVLVMQFASGGELYDYLSEKKVLGDNEARRIFRQIAAAVYYCHKNKICHRDLKLENILLDEKGNAKIADFGLSNVFDERHLLKTYCGSPLYASPEIVKGVPYYGPEVDCWSMGVLLYTLVYGAMPFDGSNFKKLVTQISEGDYFEPKKKSKASSLIQKLLTVNPAKRATIVDICTDWWVNQGYEHSLLQVAEDMANLTPVRLDLLLALAPGSPIPPDDSNFQENQSAEDVDSDAIPDSSLAGKDIHDEAEEDYDDDDDDNTETVATSFAYVKGSRSSHLSSNSSPNLLEATKKSHEVGDEDGDEFLPADVAAALEGQSAKRERSFDGSLVRISSLAHQSKKTKKSESSVLASKNVTHLDSSNKQILPNKSNQSDTKEVVLSHCSLKRDSPYSDINEECVSSEINDNSEADLSVANDASHKEGESLNENILESCSFKQQENENKEISKEEILDREKREEDGCNTGIVFSNDKEASQHSKAQRRGSFIAQDEIASADTKKAGRHPGKIIIPKTFSSPQNSPSPKTQGPKTPTGTVGSQICAKETKTKPVSHSSTNISSETSSEPQNNSSEAILTNRQKQVESPMQKELDSNNITLSKNVVGQEDNIEGKKLFAKGILKKGIAKAKLAERRMSQQSSFDSDIPTPSIGSVGTPDSGPSFFKCPKPYKKDDEQQLKSNAEIILNSASKSASSDENGDLNSGKNDSVWGTTTVQSSSDKQIKQLQNKNTEWNTLSSTLDSEMSGWRQQLEESLRKLSPEESERTSLHGKSEDDKPLVPIARSYKKFTFTKDGACITETKKIYATPGADGSWTKVEKKTKITTRPGNAEEFEKFRDLHLRNDSPLTRSDSQSSSGSTDIYDDIFDSWTGDTMLCNMMKMNNVFQKFSRDPFLRHERKRNPFRQFRRADSERNERERRRLEIRSGHSTDKESSDNEEDYDVHFDGANPVVYGSQGLWQFLRSTNKGFPGHVSMSKKEPSAYTRSISQDRSESKYGNWKRCDSRNSSGYNTGTRSHSRDRTESPREKVLRFVFESPHQGNEVAANNKSQTGRNDPWSFKRTVSYNPRRDSGVGSDGYESEHSVRRTPSDDHWKSGQVSPLLSAYKPDIFKSLKKPWPREFVSPAVSPPSVQHDAAFERPDNLAESRRHRVEQWLHMSDINNPNFPFDTNEELNSHSSSRNSPVVHGNKSSVYGTMRPREYMRYYRSSSDKLADFDFDYFPSFDESQRSRSIHNLHKSGGFSGEGIKMRPTGAVYSPVSEESSHGTRSVHHSDSSHSNSSVHRINFTISDARVSSSHMPSHTATKFVRSHSSSLDGQVSEDSSNNFRIEKGQSRNVGHPIVQMKVSFNRDNRESPVIHLTSQSQLPSSKGLWQQQDKPSKPLNVQDRNLPVREISPLPGIRKFSTEIVHPVSYVADSRESPTTTSNVRRTRSGSGENIEENAFEGENNSGKSSPGNPHRGKNGPCSPSLMCDFVPFNACLRPSMENLRTVANTNIQSNDHSSAFPNACSTRHTNKLKNFDLESSSDIMENIYHPTIHQGANTPDSLEDIAFEDTISELKECNKIIQRESDGEKAPSNESPITVRPNNTFQLEIKPLGVLWDNCKLKSSQDVRKFRTTKSEFPTSNTKRPNFSGCSEIYPILPCNNSGDSEKNKNLNGPEDVLFNNKQTQNNLDLLNLLSNDGFDNFRSTMGVLKSSQIDICENQNNAQNIWSSGRLENISKNFQDPLLPNSVLNERLSVIDSLEYDDTRKQRLPKIMPSLLDDLQSPKEVLRQAMKLCDAFEN